MSSSGVNVIGKVGTRWFASFILIAALSACAVERVNIEDLEPSRPQGAAGPIDATVLVYIPTEYKNRRALHQDEHGKLTLLDGETLEESLLTVGQKYFKSVKPYSEGTPADFVLAVDGVLLASPAPAAFHARTELKGNLFGSDGQLIGAVFGEHSASSDWKTVENNIYNNFARASLDLYDHIIAPPLGSEVSAYFRDREAQTVNIDRLGETLEIELVQTGSGFIVNQGGDVVTNRHVVDGCITVSVARGEEILPSAIVSADETIDLAVLRTNAPASAFADLKRQRESLRLGEEVVTLGFPLHGVLASQPSLTTGVVSALAGIKDDENFLQISAPIQVGNSGGPLLDTTGAVIGVVSHKLNSVAIAEVTGDLPENVNFAAKSGVLADFLSAHEVAYTESSGVALLRTPDIAERAATFTVQVLCNGVKKESIQASRDLSNAHPSR